jgi:hypothetical protein
VGNSKIHEFICDYVEGRLDSELVLSFERLMDSNPIIRAFVDASAKGKATVQRVSAIRSEPAVKINSKSIKSIGWKAPTVKYSAGSGIIIVALLSALIILGSFRLV